MKYRKQVRILQGVTAIRIKLGLTQLALAQYLGISKSLVSMVENGHRSLPTAALIKISELEMAAADAAIRTKGKSMILHKSHTADPRQELRVNIDRLQQSQRQYRMEKNNEQYSRIAGAIIVVQSLLDHPGFSGDAVWVKHEEALFKKLKKCSRPGMLNHPGNYTVMAGLFGRKPAVDPVLTLLPVSRPLPAAHAC